jgi:hypothetical protein
LAQSIDPSTAAAADMVKAKLTSVLRDKRKVPIAAKNTELLGRIFQIERLYGSPAQGFNPCVWALSWKALRSMESFILSLCNSLRSKSAG